MRQIDSRALTRVSEALDLSGSGSGLSELDDGTLQQLLEVGPLVSRERAPGKRQGGLWWGQLANVHTGAGTESTSQNLYAPAPLTLLNSYPAILPDDFDIWLILAQIYRSTGAGDLTGGMLLMTLSAQAFAWGIDEGGDPLVDVSPTSLALWDGLDGTVSGEDAVGTLFGGGTVARFNYRVPRTVNSLRFESVATAAATFRCNVLFGAAPAGLANGFAV